MLEKVHSKFIKFILGVRSNSSNIPCRGELGSYPILYHVILNIIRYWCHLINPRYNSNTILVQALKESQYLDSFNRDSWIGCVKHIFKYLKLEYIFNNHTYSKKFILNKVKENLKIKFNQIWHKHLHDDQRKKNPLMEISLELIENSKQTLNLNPISIWGPEYNNSFKQNLELVPMT